MLPVFLFIVFHTLLAIELEFGVTYNQTLNHSQIAEFRFEAKHSSLEKGYFINVVTSVEEAASYQSPVFFKTKFAGYFQPELKKTWFLPQQLGNNT